MHKNKAKGTRFEYDVKHALQMLSFDVFRAWSSIGVADLSAHPPWNPMGVYRGLLIQAKDQKAGDYLKPFERDHVEHLQQINSAMVCIFYKENSKCMVKIWESKEVLTFDEFIQKYYGIPCRYSDLLLKYKMHAKPIHLYNVDKDEKDRPVSSFQDFYSVGVYFPHVPERYRKKHI